MMIHLMHLWDMFVLAVLGIIILLKNCHGKLWKTVTYAGSYKAWQQITSLVFIITIV